MTQNVTDPKPIGQASHHSHLIIAENGKAFKEKTIRAPEAKFGSRQARGQRICTCTSRSECVDLALFDQGQCRRREDWS